MPETRALSGRRGLPCLAVLAAMTLVCLPASGEDGVYTSPTGTFKVRVPGSPSGMRTNEFAGKPGGWDVSFTDDLCRQFFVEERRQELGGTSLGAWVDVHVIPQLKESKAKIKSRESLTTALGPVVRMRVLVPKGAPCGQGSAKDGAGGAVPYDFDVGIYILYSQERIYKLAYGHPPAGSALGRLSQTVDAGLAEFVKGFEVIAVPQEKPAAKP